MSSSHLAAQGSSKHLESCLGHAVFSGTGRAKGQRDYWLNRVDLAFALDCCKIMLVKLILNRHIMVCRK